MVAQDSSLVDLLERALAGEQTVLSELHSLVAATVFDPSRPAGWLHLAVPVVRRLASHEPREDLSDEEGLEVALRLARQIWHAGPPFGWNIRVVSALDRLLDKVSSERAAWQRCMDTLAHICTPEALKTWTERVVERSGVAGDLWSLIWLAIPGSETLPGPPVLHHPHSVFPRLLDAMQERELWPLVVSLANASVGLETHPMVAYVDALEEMLRGGMVGRTTLGGYAPALIAVQAMGSLEDERSLELLVEASQATWPELQVAAVVALGKRGHPDARQNLILLTRWPATHVPAVRAIRDMGEFELAENCASDEDLSFRSKIGTWAARIRLGGRFPDVVETLHTEWMNWPGRTEPVPVMVGRFSAEDPQHLLMDGAGHLVSVNGRLVGPDFGISAAMEIPDILGLACGIELRNRGRLSEERVSWSDEREQIDRIWEGDPGLSCVQPRFGVRIPSTLAYPRRGRGLLFLSEAGRVVVSSALHGTEEGWVVREGPFISWYSRARWPAKTSAEEVVWSHIGRRLLYLDGTEERGQEANDSLRGPTDEALLEALEHEEATEAGAPEGWGSLERCLGMATVLGRIACALAVRGDYPSDVVALISLAQPVRKMLESPERCGELLWVDRFVECSLGLVTHGVQAVEGSESAEVFLGQAAEAWKSAECTAGILEASVSIGCDSISEAMVDRLAEREEGWQWPERVDSILRARLAQGQECEVDAYIRLQLQNLQNTDRLNGRSRAMDFEPISTLLDLEQAWQGWRDVHRGLFGDSRPLGLDFPLSILTEV